MIHVENDDLFGISFFVTVRICDGVEILRAVEKLRLETELLCLGRFSVVPGPGEIEARDSKQF